MTTQLTDRFNEALVYATRIHDGQLRKGPAGIPYISHPLAVASLILEAGGAEDEAIAGLLHDAAEDTGGEARLSEIAEFFGERVADTVRGCSDSLEQDPQRKAPWRERKEAHLKHLEQATSSVLIVTAADKLHNGRSLVEDLTADPLYLSHFNAGDDDVLWYYQSMHEALVRLEAPKTLTDSLGRTVSSLAAVMRVNRGHRSLETPFGDWIRAVDALFPADKVTTVDYSAWRTLQEAEPRPGQPGMTVWTVRTTDAILDMIPTAQAWVWLTDERWQLQVFDHRTETMIVAFRSDGTWVESDGRLSGWSSILEGGPPEVARNLFRKALPDLPRGGKPGSEAGSRAPHVGPPD